MRYGNVAIVAIVLMPAVATAGSDSRDCETADKSIVMSGGNSPTLVRIKIVDVRKQAGIHEAPVQIMPNYTATVGADSAELLVAIPISAEKVVSKSHKRMHVEHEDGTRCTGRESWDDRSIQSYVLTAKGGERVTRAIQGTPVKGLTPDGYLIAEFRCHTYGVTSPGGCFAEPGDKVEWRDF